MQKLIFTLILTSFFWTTLLLATISVEPGTYEKTVLVMKAKDGPVVVFNPKSRSMLRLKLTGAKTNTLPDTKFMVLTVKFKIEKRIEAGEGHAELLEFQKPNANTPLVIKVKNDLEPYP